MLYVLLFCLCDKNRYALPLAFSAVAKTVSINFSKQKGLKKKTGTHLTKKMPINNPTKTPVLENNNKNI